MKFAFLIIRAYDPKVDRAQIGDVSAQIVGVPDLASACEVAHTFAV